MMMVGRILAIGMLAFALVSGTGATAYAQSQEGITVHGRWTIDVRNADGSLAAHHEFNNALDVLNGGRSLAGLLGRFYRTIDSWRILLVTNQVGACAANPGGQNCPITEYRGSGPAPMGFLNVVVPTFVVNGNITIPSTGTFELRAMTQFQLDASITSVQTGIDVCQGTTCVAPLIDFYPFTAHALTTPIGVAANQVVQVTVVFSFT